RGSGWGPGSPSATIPYFGSGSVIVWPPRRAAPALLTTSTPPCRTWPSISSGRASTGQATMFSARNGRAPIAYTSESALVAAILPQSYGSSTIGVKKSSVATSAWPSGRRTTAASSPVSAATSTSAPSSGRDSVPRTVSRSAGPSLHPHPAPWLKLVSRRCSMDRGCHTALHADRRRRAHGVGRVRPRRARAGCRRHRARDGRVGGTRRRRRGRGRTARAAGRLVHLLHGVRGRRARQVDAASSRGAGGAGRDGDQGRTDPPGGRVRRRARRTDDTHAR